MPLVRRRRPLLRAAAVGGAAYMGKRAGERQAAEPAPAEGYPPPAQGYAPPPPPSNAGMSSESVARLKELAELRDQGILTDQEFEEQKRALLGGGG
jgi:Short C-terminal domain